MSSINLRITENLLSLNSFSRPGMKMETVSGVVIHWVANAGTTALQNRNFFESRKDGGKGFGSAHYIINLDGEIILCIPGNEVAWHVGAKEYKPDIAEKLGNSPNYRTIGIECTHIDANGRMTKETYQALVDLCIELCRKYNLRPDQDLYLHYHITGKDCHKWFVDNPAEWDQFIESVRKKA